jgi:hypothetical protein
MQVIKMNQQDIKSYPSNIINKKNLSEMLTYLFIRIESKNESMRRLALHLNANTISKEELYEQLKSYTYHLYDFLGSLSNECLDIGLNIEALYFLSKMYEKCPEDPYLSYKIAYCFYNLKAYDKALEIINKNNFHNDEIDHLRAMVMEEKNE